MSRPAPAADIENAIHDYLSGESLDLVSRRHRVGYGRLRGIIESRGLLRTSAETSAIRSSRVAASLLSKSDLPSAEIVRRYLAGESSNALAKSFGVSRRAIDYRLDAAGVDRRGSADANRLMMAARTPEENAANSKAAHEAVRGRRRSIEERSKGAATRERLRTHVSDNELILATMLRERGLDVIPQKAVGPYNVDLAAGTVAVEVFGGGWHAYGVHRERASERLRYILDEGWNLVIVWASASRWPIGPGACDYIATFAEVTSGNPPTRGEYRVIWGDGKEAAIDGANVDDLSVKPSRRGCKRAGAGDNSAG